MLNAKQEKFIQNIVKGMSQREAYKDAYKATYADKDIDSKACNLFNSDKVQARYKELIKKLEDEAIMTAEERMKWLTEVVKDIQREEANIKMPDGEEILIGMKNADLNTKIKAIDTLNKMSGVYVTKLEGNVNVSYEEAIKEVADSDEY